MWSARYGQALRAALPKKTLDDCARKRLIVIGKWVSNTSCFVFFRRSVCVIKSADSPHAWADRTGAGWTIRPSRQMISSADPRVRVNAKRRSLMEMLYA
ncbi:hypothetical protein Bxe_C0699 [Paraburkholderia xenovorans LB400]|uniref:Uncharacterized protein n=1 Tax=Paraburkholderia xenovorans (strain LB400) TaxID=266265 RepID=Q13GW7_PARXL|nr:hypothetical protein Bxe_C0699 [Paraburkholderia xenovorans LB400]